MEFSLIKLLLERTIFLNYGHYVGVISNRELQKIFYTLVELHKGGKDSYSIEELELCFLASYPSLKDSERALFNILFKKIELADADRGLVEKYFKSLKTKEKARQIAILALDVSEGRDGATIESLQDAINGLEVGVGIEDEIEFVSTSLQYLLEEEVYLPGLTWRLAGLNQSIGPIRKGNLIHIFGRVETGKSALWISEVTHMVKQLPEDETALIFFNEEGGRDIVYRLYSAMLGKTYNEVLENPEQSEEEFNRQGGDRIRFVDRPVLIKEEMESIIKLVNPGLIIIDNIDKVKAFTETDRRDLSLGEIYKWARTTAKTYCPVICVAQADATAHNRKWLDESMMADSKVGKPAELDVIIGIGRTNKEGFDNTRHIHIPKNKLRGGPETIESHRHAKFDVIIKPELSLYQDI